MHAEHLRDFCLSLPGTTEKFPFDEHVLVFSVMGKMYCLVNITDYSYINLKCEPEKAVQLREQYPAVTPGYHMNKQHWNSVSVVAGLPLNLVEKWIADSYWLVVQKLPKKLKEELKELKD
jgi:predicted DNA-binding protein (MmcQ/YjbR family)